MTSLTLIVQFLNASVILTIFKINMLEVDQLFSFLHANADFTFI
ncbi:hypothetical protein Trichorick_00639 [Candidatus Trichorickettsia mobilis]|uniref:Uncharacterized protein n=1 Tax=Candidatus Trichorickettsia mobilis TaxID=1346319 RepID=A0ABZ0URU4_9RICK|nr:hypothetical protein Trichorick_00639 [Candidatus Trichorickettsia mobilis]